MATTLEAFAGKQAGNYSSNPTIDVEILDPAARCWKCGDKIIWDKTIGISGQWIHEDETAEREYHSVSARTRCRYCGTDDPEVVVSSQEAWYDRTHCSRCDGVTGFAIGD